MDGDHLSVARRSMEVEGEREGRGAAKLNMWLTVSRAWLNVQQLYLPNEHTLPTSPTHTAFINK